MSANPSPTRNGADRLGDEGWVMLRTRFCVMPFSTYSNLGTVPFPGEAGPVGRRP